MSSSPLDRGIDHHTTGTLVAIAAGIAIAAGCAPAATFHSRNGANYPRVAMQAIRCDAAQFRAARTAGGIVIGTITSHGNHFTNAFTPQDLIDRTAVVAAEHGGTHFLITAEGIDTFTSTDPGSEQRTCQRDRDGDRVDCETTYTPPSTSTSSEPTARAVVLRIEAAAWQNLSAELRPVANR